MKEIYVSIKVKKEALSDPKLFLKLHLIINYIPLFMGLITLNNDNY